MHKNVLDIYGVDYQLSLVKYFIEDPIFFRSVTDYIEEQLFTDEYVNVLYSELVKHYKKHNVVPTYDILISLIRMKYHSSISKDDELIKDILLKFIDKIKNESSKNKEYIQNSAITFCKLKHLEKSAEETVNFLSYYSQHSDKDPDFDPIIQKYKHISKISIDNVDTDIFESIRDVFAHKMREHIIPTTYPLLDYLLDGGIGSKDLFTIAAFTNVGKTRLAINFGAIACQAGKKVLHFTFENTKNYIAKHYYSRLIKIPVRELEDIYTQKMVINNVEKLHEKTGGGIHVQEFPMRKYGLGKLETVYSQLVDCDKEPDIIIIDSPLHLKSTVTSDNKKNLVAQIFGDVKGFAQDINKPIIATAQLNRLAAKEEKSSTDKIGDAIEIAQDSDAMLIMNRTDAMRDDNKVMFNLAKNRYGRNEVQFGMKFYASMCYFEEDESDTLLQMDRIKNLDMIQKTQEQKLMEQLTNG